MFAQGKQQVLSDWNEKNSYSLAEEREDLKTKWGSWPVCVVIRQTHGPMEREGQKKEKTEEPKEAMP